jgi:hypothetical protein
VGDRREGDKVIKVSTKKRVWEFEVVTIQNAA